MRLAAAAFVGLVAGAVCAGEAPLGRLGHDVRPLRQEIALDLDPRKPDYAGTVDIVVDVVKPVRSFDFHAEKLELLSLRLLPAGRPSGSIRLTATELPDGRVEASAGEKIPKGRYTLHIEFRNDFDTEAKGLYRLRSGDEWYAFTQFEAIDAREAFPCWDEPSFKVPYRLTLTVPLEHVAIANTLVESERERDGKRTTVFKPTRPLPSYLLAAATGPLELVPIPGTSIPARVVTVKGQSGLAGDAVRLTPKILGAAERYFGGRHPYDKLDLIAVPEYWYGAMENPGAITFVDRRLLVAPGAIDPEWREGFVVTTAHELAHMWFGDLVTMAWWDDLWLNESLASWMEDKITAEVDPALNTEAGEVRSAQSVMGLDALVTTRAIRQPIQSMDSLLLSADDLAYAKGAAVLHMIERWIGPAAFRQGVLAYLAAHADGNATADDFWSALSETSGKDVASVLSSFLDQAGVPLVTVDVLAGGKVRLSQSRYLNAGAKAPGPQAWRIPVTLRYPVGESTKLKTVILSKREQVVSLDTRSAPAWIHPNAEEAGYYRWRVPADIVSTLSADAERILSTRERIGFLGNGGALLGAGLLRGNESLRMLEAFAADPDPEVVGVVLDGLQKTRRTFFAEERDAEFAPFVRRTLAPALARFGAEPRPGELERVAALRPKLLEILGDAGHDEAVLDRMESLAKDYLADPASVDPALAEKAITLSAIRGDRGLFDTYRTRFEQATTPVDRRRFLSALGSFRDPALAECARAYVFEGPLRPQELLWIPRIQAEIPSEAARTYEWMTAHYSEIAARMPPDFMVFMPMFAGGCSSERVASAKAFFSDAQHAPPGTSRELSRVEESVGECVSLNAREGESARRYASTVR